MSVIGVPDKSIIFVLKFLKNGTCVGTGTTHIKYISLSCNKKISDAKQ